MEYLLNIKSNWKHSTLEYLIRKYDYSQDISRSAVLKREIKAAEGVKNWKEYQLKLADLKREEEAPIFTSLQAKYDNEVTGILEKVKKDILEQLSDSMKILQAQYMVQLLQINYLEKLKQDRLSIQPILVTEEDINLPEMSKIFTEMILTDKDGKDLKQIKNILVKWRNEKRKR